MRPPSAASAREVLRWQFRCVHGLMQAACDQAGAPYASIVVCEDVIINGVLRAQAPLALSTWRDGTGLSELPPLTQSLERRAWMGRVQIEPRALGAYARAVHAATDAYLATPVEDAELTLRVLTALLLSLSRWYARYASGPSPPSDRRARHARGAPGTDTGPPVPLRS